LARSDRGRADRTQAKQRWPQVSQYIFEGSGVAYDLRPYQQRSIDQLFAWFDAGNKGNPLMVLPTGAGKSVILAAAIKTILEQWPNQRIAVVTHVKELIEQNFEKLVSIWPFAPAGIYSASIGRKDAVMQVLYAGIQSIAGKLVQAGGWFDLIFIDECHLVPKKGQGQYRQFIEAVQRINPQVRVIGLTATEFRLDSGLLHSGEGAIFSDIAAEVSVLELLELGYLAPLVSRPTHIDLDMRDVKRRGGEFITGDLDRVMHEQDHIRRALDNAMTAGADRNHWLVFCPSVATANEAKDYLRAAGKTADIVTGQTGKAERERITTEFKAGKIQALCNVDVLTTGFDAPCIDCIVMLRPTESTALYIQMMGRGMRLHTGKENCLVLDYAGNIERHGCIDDPNIKIPRDKKEPGDAPIKICPECEAYNHASARQCPECGFEFPAPQPKVEKRHSVAPILSTQREPEIYEVSGWYFDLHQKDDKPDSMRVEYWGGLGSKVAAEWVCFEHGGFATQKAQQWWYCHEGQAPCPSTTDEALSRTAELRQPARIELVKDGKYSRIARIWFAQKVAA